MFGIGGCEEVWSSIFWALRRGKCEHQMKGYVVEQKVSDWLFSDVDEHDATRQRKNSQKIPTVWQTNKTRQM